MALPETSDINFRLREYGYPALPDFSPIPGFGVSVSGFQFTPNLVATARFRSWVLESDENGWSTRLTSMAGSFEGGSVIIHTPAVMLYLTSGLTYGVTSSTIEPDEAMSYSVRSILGNPPDTSAPVSLQGTQTGLKLEAAIDVTLLHDEAMDWEFVAGLKMGGGWNLQSTWMVNGHTVRDVDPHIPAYYALVSLGIRML